MKTRVLTGLVAGIAAILALLFLPVIGIRIAVMVLCVIGSYEMLSTLGLKNHKPMLIVSSLFAAGSALKARTSKRSSHLLSPVWA